MSWVIKTLSHIRKTIIFATSIPANGLKQPEQFQASLSPLTKEVWGGGGRRQVLSFLGVALCCHDSWEMLSENDPVLGLEILNHWILWTSSTLKKHSWPNTMCFEDSCNIDKQKGNNKTKTGWCFFFTNPFKKYAKVKFGSCPEVRVKIQIK